ncbi:helix-turn-helix domain-containing protein [Agrobacterium tumefaciens]
MLKSAGESKAAVARDLKISRITIYRALEAENTLPES